MAYNSNYTGAEVQDILDSVKGKVDKVEGKGLSEEDFTTILKQKLEGLSNYDDTGLSNALSTLRGDFDKLVSGDTTTAIKTFNEIVAFLDGIQDTQDLSGIISSIEQQIAAKMDKVTLATVATSGSYTDLSDKPTIPNAVTEITVEGWGFTKNTGTYSMPSDGIPKTDLARAVQASLENADSALQSIPDTYATKDELLWIQAEGEAGVRLKGTNGTATGNLAISAGDDKTASDGTAYPSAASGDHAVAFGYGNTCAGRSTLAQGLYNIVNGKDAVAFGQRNTVNGDQAFAAGQLNEVTTRLGVTIGYQNKATNTNSIAIGYKNTSGGSGSVALGDTCESSGTSSTAMGYKTKASGAYSSTFGENTQATNKGEVAMGAYNKSTTSTNTSEQTAFSFGIGTSDTNRQNAFEIKKNGDVYIGDTLLNEKVPVWDDKADASALESFATKEYVASAITESITNVLNTEV